jgi:AIPR protein
MRERAQAARLSHIVLCERVAGGRTDACSLDECEHLPREQNTPWLALTPCRSRGTRLPRNARADTVLDAPSGSSRMLVGMDRIIKNLVDKFSAQHGLQALGLDRQFEHFANYCIVATRGPEETFDVGDVTVDGNEVGIDGLAIQINGRIVTDSDEVDGLARTNGYLEVNFIFVQAKTAEGFDIGAVEKMARAIKDFFHEEPDLPSSEFLDRCRSIKEAVYSDATLFRQRNPIVEAFMVTTGRWDEPSVIRASMTAMIQELMDTRLFADVQVAPVDADDLNDRYRRASAPPEATVTFDRRSTLPAKIGGVDSAYVGIMQGAEFLKLIEDDEGRLRASLFEDNVRDFQGSSNPVNHSMATTIESDNFPRFAVLNNGVTVIARRVSTVGDEVTVFDYQIVNGCQTANVIHANAKHARAEGFWVPVKIVATGDEELITEIVTATNSQTPVTAEDLQSRSRFERRLEQYFESTGGLRYERRSRQYTRDSTVPAARVITRRVLVRSYVSFCLDQPHRATGYVTDLLRALGTSHFVDAHRLEPYYASALAYWKLDNMFQTRIPRELKPARWYLLMAFRHLALGGEPLGNLDSKKAARQASKLSKALEDDAKAFRLFTDAASVVRDVLAGQLDRDQLRGERPVSAMKAALDVRTAS